MNEEERDVSFHQQVARCAHRHRCGGAGGQLPVRDPGARGPVRECGTATSRADRLRGDVRERGRGGRAGGRRPGDRGPTGRRSDSSGTCSRWSRRVAGRPLVLVVERDPVNGSRSPLHQRRVESTDSAGGTVSRGQLGVRGGTVEYHRSDPLLGGVGRDGGDLGRSPSRPWRRSARSSPAAGAPRNSAVRSGSRRSPDRPRKPDWRRRCGLPPCCRSISD